MFLKRCWETIQLPHALSITGEIPELNERKKNRNYFLLISPITLSSVTILSAQDNCVRLRRGASSAISPNPSPRFCFIQICKLSVPVVCSTSSSSTFSSLTETSWCKLSWFMPCFMFSPSLGWAVCAGLCVLTMGLSGLWVAAPEKTGKLVRSESLFKLKWLEMPPSGSFDAV